MISKYSPITKYMYMKEVYSWSCPPASQIPISCHPVHPTNSVLFTSACNGFDFVI